MRTTLALTLLLFCYSSPADEVLGLPQTFQTVLGEWKEKKPIDADKALPVLFQHYGRGDFTLANKSESEQGQMRALMFGKGGETIFGIGENEMIEAAVSTSGPAGTVPYRIEIKKDGTQHAFANPTACIRCHTSEFVYIWRQYREWPAFLGGFEDIVDPNSVDFRAMKTHERFKAFFENAPRATYPYWDNTSEETKNAERKYANMPNTRLSDIIGARAALSVVNRAKGKFTERFQQVGHALLYIMVCHNDDRTDIEKSFLDLFRKASPTRFATWEAIVKGYDDEKHESRYIRLLEMRMLDFLGVPPYGMILQMPWKRANPMASFEAYKTFMGNQYEANGYSCPLEYNVDGKRFSDFVEGALGQVLGVVPKEWVYDFSNEYALSSELYAGKPDPKTMDGIAPRIKLPEWVDSKRPKPVTNFCKDLHDKSLAQLKTSPAPASVPSETPKHQ